MSEHWYTQGGQPAYTVNGRDTTLRDARKLSLVPSVTTVTGIIDKPALTNWLIDQAIMASLTLPRVDGETDEAWLSRIKVDGRAQAKTAAEEGSRIHDAIEKGFTGAVPDEYFEHCDAVYGELLRLFPDVNDWISEKSFAHPLGYGGKVDLHSPSTGIVVDFKTKDGDFSDGKRLHYDQNIQLAAYQVGLCLCGNGFAPTPEYPQPYTPTQCANIFVSRTHPGAVASHVWSADEIAKGWRTFEAVLNLWKILRGYDASW